MSNAYPEPTYVGPQESGQVEPIRGEDGGGPREQLQSLFWKLFKRSACELMPHVQLPEHEPGIIGLLVAYPETEKPLNDLANVLMTGPSSLSRAERELIAARVSSGNECRFCTNSHAAVARHLYGDEQNIVDKVLEGAVAGNVDAKMEALLAVAEKVRQDGRLVMTSDIERARRAGADDRAIHDTVLIAAMFSMFNRYVDGLATWMPENPSVYEEIGARIAAHGYGSRFRK